MPAKSLGEKLFEAFANDGWASRSADNQAMYERYALAFAASLSHDETANAVIADLRQRLHAAEERAEKAEGDRDALRAAIGFKPGPLKDDRDDDIVIIDAKALRPAMVEARRQRDDAQSKLWDSHAHAAQEIRAWVKERFGKWITHKTAWTVADRIFGSERAALKTGA